MLDCLVRRHLSIKYLDLIVKVRLEICNSFVCQKVSIREDFRHNSDLVLLHPAFSCVYHYFRYTLHFLKVSFDLFRINVLSVRENYQILLSSGYIYPSFFIELSVVTCMEEAILVEDLCCRFRIVIISEHHIRSLHADLSLSVFIRVVDLYTACKDRSTHAARLAVLISVSRDQRGTFCDSVSVKDGYSK